MKTLKQTKCGETVTVTRLGGEGALRRRIMDMGITKGTSIFVRKVAPLGDPVEITVRGYELSIPQRRCGKYFSGISAWQKCPAFFSGIRLVITNFCF